MKKSLPVLFCFFYLSSVSFSQAKDITEKINSILQGPQTFFELSGANFTDDGTIHATFEANDMRTAAYRMNNHPNVSLANARKDMTSYLMFHYAKKIFQLFPSAKIYIVYVSNIKVVRDRYGKILSQNKEIIARLTMSRETVNKIDWDYLQSIWFQHLNYAVPQILQMLDGYYFDDRYFE